MLRNAKGSPVQMKDENGKSLYEYVKLEHPKLCSSDFWAERGGQHSYGNMQDEFYEAISVRYGPSAAKSAPTKGTQPSTNGR